MDELRGPYADIETAGLHVRIDRSWHVASLRSFRPNEPFAAEFLAWSGTALPAPQKAVAPQWPAVLSTFILAWRSPSETWALSMDLPSFNSLKARVSEFAQGCCVDQTGGLWVLKATGARVVDLLLRVGALASVPSTAAAHVSRIAEVPVMTLCVNPGETLLIVERAHAEHLLNWIRATAADFEPAA